MAAAPSTPASTKLGNGVLEAMANMKEGFQYMKEAGAADSGDMMWQHQGVRPPAFRLIFVYLNRVPCAYIHNPPSLKS